MSHVSWLLVRGVFQALPVGDAYVDPDTVASQGGGAVGAVGVIRTALRGAALISVGSSRLRLLDAMPTHGPVTGNTEVRLQGTGLLTLLVLPSALPSTSYSPVCVWKCSVTVQILKSTLYIDLYSKCTRALTFENLWKEAPATTALTVVNDTAARCRSPWRSAAGACAVGVGALVDQTPILTASLAHILKSTLYSAFT